MNNYSASASVVLCVGKVRHMGDTGHVCATKHDTNDALRLDGTFRYLGEDKRPKRIFFYFA